MELFKDDFELNANAYSDNKESITTKFKQCCYTFYGKLLNYHTTSCILYAFFLFLDAVELGYYPFIVITGMKDITEDIY